jgi:uncharacterized protein
VGAWWRRSTTPAPYMNPYLAGVGIGGVLLAAFVVMGRGLGASGAFTSVTTAAVAVVAPEHAAGSAFYAPYLGDGVTIPPVVRPLRDWLVFEILGVLVGAWVSARLAGRIRAATERGPHVAASSRLWLALTGGIVMGLGAKLARGCTSGLGLTGGATLSVGSWIFVIAAFAAGYAVAPLVRRQWR